MICSYMNRIIRLSDVSEIRTLSGLNCCLKAEQLISLISTMTDRVLQDDGGINR